MDEVTLRFVFNNKEVKKIKCKRNERMEDIIKKYNNEIPISKNIYEFIYNGEKINKDNSLESINAHDNEIIIIVKEQKVNNFLKSSLEAPAPAQNVYRQSKEFICPICKNCCIIDFKDYKMTFRNCEKNHTIENLLLEEYDKTQKIRENKSCHECENKYDNIYYKCLKCKKILCSLCKSKHDKTHIIIDSNSVNYRCNIHGEKFISYCLNCKTNLCNICEKTHNKDHNISYFIKKELNYNIRDDIDNLRKKLNDFNDDINSLIKKLEHIINEMEIYWRINNDIIYNFEKQKKNYQTYTNLENIRNNNLLIIKDIDEILNTKDDINKYKLIYQIYKKMTIKQ